MESTISHMVAALQDAAYLEDGAAALLQPMLKLCSERACSGVHAERTRILRGMVHLRPAGGYDGLVVLNSGASEVTDLPGDDSLLPSATAWRWVAAHGGGMEIDVNLGRIRPLDGGSWQDFWTAGEQAARGKKEDHSRMRLLQRGASHICVLPLRTGSGRIDGIISLEARCRTAIGEDFIWNDIYRPLQLLADIAAPHLTHLSLRPGQTDLADDLLPVVGPSTARLVRMLRVFARQDETLLISGPTGAGKSRLARWCHAQSPRAAGPFEVVDLQTIPEEIQLGELFGWKKGAFTGALADHDGFVQRADRGTLFIDEIDKLSLRAQAALLHLLEERTYRVLGDSARERSADVRFLVGTNADLFSNVKKGTFREDLYYRINVLPVRLLPLKERPDEIALWARHMLERRHGDFGGDTKAVLAADAALRLLEHAWPGNLRELDNVIRRSYSLAVLERGGADGDLIVSERHIEDALSLDSRAAERSLLSALRSTALAFISELRQKAGVEGMVDLELCDVFRGYVLWAAVRAFGSREEALRHLGKENIVVGRNHHKVYKRELGRIETLHRLLDQPLDPAFEAVMCGDTEPGATA